MTKQDRQNPTSSEPLLEPGELGGDDAAASFIGTELADTAALMREVSKRVRYAQWQERMAVGTFRQLRTLAMYDLWFSDRSEEERARAAQANVKHARALRDTPEYHEVCHELKEAMAYVSKPRTLQEHIEDPEVQDAAAKRTIRMALHGTDLKVAEKALKQINDRAMAPPRPKEETQRVLMVPAEALTLMVETLALMKGKGMLPEGSIDVDFSPVADESSS